VTAGLFAPLTRPELDQLITELESEERLAHIALVNAPLRPEAVAGAAGVAQDIMCAYTDALDESVARMLAGEIPGA
jgi:hypothetical protein